MTDGKAAPNLAAATRDDLLALFSRAEEKLEVLGSIIRAACEIHSNLELAPLLHHIMQLSREIMNAEASSLMLLDKERNELIFEVALSDVGDALREVARLPVGQGIAGRVAETGKPFLTNDAYSCPLFFKGYDEKTGFRTRAILCVPMFADDEMVGVCQVINREDGSGFDEEDMELFQMFASVSAVAINNVRLREDREERRRLEREMDLAREIQESFLRHDFPAVPGYRFEAHTNPASFVGGDVYDIFPMSSGKVAALVGDVSGKGASASLYGARLLSEIRLLLEFCDDPAQVMARLNDLMVERSTRGMFVTLLLVVGEPGTHEAQILSAGHHAPLLYDIAAEDWIDVECPKCPPLGVLPDMRFEAATIRMPERALLVGYTDGLVEARNPLGVEFGLPRLRDTIAAAARDEGEDIPVILKALQGFVQDAKQHDDTTLLCARRGLA